MSEDYSDDEEEPQWNETPFDCSKQELSMDAVLEIYEHLKQYVDDMGLPILDAPYAGSFLYDTLMYKMRH